MRKLVRSESRGVVLVLLYLAAILLLFGLIGFIPGPLHDYAEDFSLRIFGQIDSQILGCAALLFVLLVQIPILGLAAMAVRFRPTTEREGQGRLELLRKQLLAEGHAPHDLGIWTEADWSRFFRRAGIVCALLTVLACAALYGINGQPPTDTRTVREIRLDSSLGKQASLDGGPIQISATARLDWAFRTAEHKYGSGKMSGTTIHIFRLDHYGFQPTSRGSRYRDTLFVPLAGSDWHPGQPVEVFYQCDGSCVFTVPKESSLLPKDVTIRGRLSSTKLPFFVKRTFERAGIAVASPYYVITDREEDHSDRVAFGALAGLLVTVLFFGLSVLYRFAEKATVFSEERAGRDA